MRCLPPSRLCLAAVYVLFAGASAPAQTEDAVAECRAVFAKGVQLAKAGKFREALLHHEKAAELAPKAFGKDSADTATILNELALAYWYLGEYAKAGPVYRRSLEIREATLGKDHPKVSESLAGLATLYVDMGEYAKAEPLYQRSLQILEPSWARTTRTTSTASPGWPTCTGESVKAIRPRHIIRPL